MLLHKWLRQGLWIIWRWFKEEEIANGERCSVIFYRWTLLRLPFGVVYLHKFVADDWAPDMHDHPLNFVSIGLWGQYIEETPNNPPKTWRAPWVRSFRAEHIHRIIIIDGKPCWTLFVGGPQVWSWGFWHDGKFVGAKKYLVANRNKCD